MLGRGLRANLGLVAVLVIARPALAQTDPVTAELDAFWAEISRTVAEGDSEGMRALYHPDGVSVSGDEDEYVTAMQTAALALAEDDLRATREGRREQGVEFRLTSRVHDATSAHEVGLFHYWAIPDGGDRVDFYGAVDSYLVKIGGRWVILVEIQRVEVAKADWDARG